ncbi:Hypothetical_protein [Hexamita inflata]|uniref:Hypothetical_protein n=1 Tax=Hexamita inflata TaxID=28002 RepID=A0AA86V1R7_9EUKA|nr:Hypothetical protein HINF_LOCUS60586 [Hexamita inflata]
MNYSLQLQYLIHINCCKPLQITLEEERRAARDWIELQLQSEFAQKRKKPNQIKQFIGINREPVFNRIQKQTVKCDPKIILNEKVQNFEENKRRKSWKWKQMIVFAIVGFLLILGLLVKQNK